MVGVPGRSKGCNTCIQRKVKCDGGQPSCGNCRKSNRLCTGYKRPVAFVMSSDVKFVDDSTPDDHENMSVMTHGRWRKRERKPPRALPKDPKKGPQAMAAAEAEAAAATAALETTISEAYPVDMAVPELSKGDLQLAKRHFASARSQEAGNTQEEAAIFAAALAGWESAIPFSSDSPYRHNGFAFPNCASTGRAIMTLTQPMASDAVWREQLYPMFLRFHLPSEIFQGCQGGQRRMQRNWMMNLQDAAFDESPALEMAMTALSMARVGRRDNHQALVSYSLDLYTKGLRQLQKALHDPRTQTSDQTLAACAAFSMYEVAECPARKPDGYISHKAGGLALLQKRGPDAHTSLLGHSLFVFERMQHFLYSLMERKSSFFSQPEWINRPWQTRAKDPHDMFMDQMYCIPVLMEKTDKLEKSRADEATVLGGYRAIIEQYQALHECLQGWYRQLRAIVAGPLYGPELATIKCPAFGEAGRPQPFPVAFHFPAFSVGQSMIVFWLIEMIANTQMGEVYRKIANIEEMQEVAASGGGASTRSPADGVYVSSSRALAAESYTLGRSMAKNICQSIEFFLQDSMGDVGAMSMLLPLTAVRHHLIRAKARVPIASTSSSEIMELTDCLTWVEYLILLVGRKGHLMAFYLNEEPDVGV